jgi:putative salt-induced outer membrane protein YdiY
MKQSRILFAISQIVILLIAVNAAADELLMKNGDRITGTVVSMKDSVLLFKTSYAGEISIRWEEISELTTDEPIRMILDDETAARGLVSTSEDGATEIVVEEILEPILFDLASVEQINPPPPGPVVKLRPRINIGASVAKGNTETETYHMDGQLLARTEKNRYTIGGEYNREEDEDEKTADNTLGYMKYDHFLTEKWYFNSNASFENDEFKDLNLRTTVGAGMGYQFFESELLNLSAELGLAYVNTDYDVADDESNVAGRWGAIYDQYFLDKRVQFFHVHEGFVSLEDSSDIFVRSRTGFRLPLFDKFNATIQYNFDWDNAPSPGDDRVDEMYIFTLGYGN